MLDWELTSLEHWFSIDKLLSGWDKGDGEDKGAASSLLLLLRRRLRQRRSKLRLEDLEDKVEEVTMEWLYKQLPCHLVTLVSLLAYPPGPQESISTRDFGITESVF